MDKARPSNTVSLVATRKVVYERDCPNCGAVNSVVFQNAHETRQTCVHFWGHERENNGELKRFIFAAG